MEDEEGIGLILARATELRLKISDCIDSSSGNENSSPGNQEKDFDSISSDEVEEQEAERLLRIRDALESLESQLAALQNLRQRQQYEKQVALSEIDYSRKMLLEKLNEYKGKEFQVLREASTFAGERVDYENDLLLPSYPVHPPRLDNNANGFGSGHVRKETEVKGEPICFFAKIILPIIGVISILSASGYGPEFLPQRVVRGKKTPKQCPPGKVLVIEDGEPRCLVKERIEIPFDSVVTRRDVTYGYG